MVDWGAVVAHGIAFVIAAAGVIAVAELAERRGWTHRVEPRELDGWMGRSIRDPGERDRPSIKTVVVVLLVFVLFHLLVLATLTVLGVE